MPLMITPRTLGVLAKAERRKVGASYIVTTMGLFDLAKPDAERFENSQSLWLLAAKALPKGSFLDIGMPKPQAELLVAGFARAPDGEPTSAMSVEWLVGPLRKRLIVFGDRYWTIAGSGYAATEPRPFVEVALSPERAFGGPGHADNPNGLGFRAGDRLLARELVMLPNVESADQLVHTIEDRPPPALCGPLDIASPKRLRYAGAYDNHWLKQVAPALPDDVDPRLFLFAPEDQIFPTYLKGGEPYALRGFSDNSAELRGNLPNFRVRCFLARKPTADAPAQLVEMPMRIDTLWLFAGARRGVLIYRGALPVTDIDADDISEVMLAYERGADEPRSLEHYLEVWNLRRVPETAFKYAFSEGQLAPSLAPEVVAQRNAERAARAREVWDKHRAAQSWMIQRNLAKSGIPEELWPALPEPEPDPELMAFPIPTPEEIASGEIDLAAILDAADALQERMAKKAEEVQAKGDKATQAMAGLRAPGAGPDAVDALFAALDGLDGKSPANILDEALAGLQAPAMPNTVDPKIATDVVDKLDQVKDWRRAMLEAAAPQAVDEEAEFQAARARFFDLPEGRPLAEMRKALTSARFDTPKLPAFEPPAELSAPARPSDPARVDLEALLDSLDRESRLPEPTSPSIRAKLHEVDDQLRKNLPNLAPGGGSAIEAMAALATPAAGAAAALPSDDPQEVMRYAMQRRDEALAQAESSLDVQEGKLAEGLGQMRRGAPTPLYPQKPMTGPLAHRFGALIIAERRSGADLRGRDLAGAELRSADLQGADLEGALLEQADLRGARLAGARLANAALTGAILDDADLSDTDLASANLNNCRARGANFARSQLSKSTLIEADFSSAHFEGATLSEMTMLKGIFDKAVFANAKLDKNIFLQTSLAGSVWDGADLKMMQFVDLTMTGASFRGARLFRCAFLKMLGAGSDFSDADVTRSCFVGPADLSGARFDRATCSDSSFHGAKLDGASFERSAFNRAAFGGSDLTRANFRLASLKRSIFSGATLVGADAVGANFLYGQFRKADLSGARLLGANLYGGSFDHAKFVAADLTGANLDKTILAVDTNAG